MNGTNWNNGCITWAAHPAEMLEPVAAEHNLGLPWTDKAFQHDKPHQDIRKETNERHLTKKKQTNQTTYQTHQTLPNFEVKLSQVAHSLILRDRQALNRLHRCHGFLHLEPFPGRSMVGSLVVPWSVPVFPGVSRCFPGLFITKVPQRLAPFWRNSMVSPSWHVLASMNKCAAGALCSYVKEHPKFPEMDSCHQDYHPANSHKCGTSPFSSILHIFSYR